VPATMADGAGRECVAGTYAGAGASSCLGTVCAAGTYGPAGATSATTATCVDCTAGGIPCPSTLVALAALVLCDPYWHLHFYASIHLGCLSSTLCVHIGISVSLTEGCAGLVCPCSTSSPYRDCVTLWPVPRALPCHVVAAHSASPPQARTTQRRGHQARRHASTALQASFRILPALTVAGNAPALILASAPFVPPSTWAASFSV